MSTAKKSSRPRGRPRSVPIQEVLAMKLAKVPARVIAKKLGICQRSVESVKLNRTENQ